MGRQSYEIRQFWHHFSCFMRHQGLAYLYVLYAAAFSVCYVNFLTVDDGSKFEPSRRSDGWQPTMWAVMALRLVGLLLSPLALMLAAGYLRNRSPALIEGLDSDRPIGSIANLSVGRSPEQKRPLDCLIVQIVTRGDYPRLIKRNVAYHLALIERYCRCDRLEAHVITEQSIGGDYRQGSAVVKEILVPDDYRTPHGTLFKARNIVYWLEHGPGGDQYPPEDRTWILALDEDVFLTETFMRVFVDDFLDSGAECSVSPTVVYFPTDTGLPNSWDESFFVSLTMTVNWAEARLTGRAPQWFRGAGYVVRRDVDRSIGRDFGARLSVSDDHTFGHFAADRRVKFGYINGFVWEGGAQSYAQLVQQRARWLRGHVYSLTDQRLSFGRKLASVYRFGMCFVVLPVAMLLGLAGTAIMCTGHHRLLMHSVVRIWPLDYLCAFVFATCFFVIVYGSWHTLPGKKAFVNTVGVLGWFFIAGAFVCYLNVVLWLAITLIDDAIRRRQRFEVTAKKDS